jgi:hypothetical protein
MGGKFMTAVEIKKKVGFIWTVGKVYLDVKLKLKLNWAEMENK